MAESYDVFISHKSEYKPWVIWLAESLQRAGLTVFLDIWNLIPGDSWVDGLHRGLEGCRAAVLVATPEVINSGWVRLEHQHLMRRRQAEPDFRLIPVVFGEIPNLPFLADIQAVDFRNSADYRTALHRLLCGLKGEAPGREARLPAGMIAPPNVRAPEAAGMVPGEVRFLDRLMARMNRPSAPPMLVLSRGQRYQGPVIHALLARARTAHAEENVLHVTPPYSERVEPDDYFREIGRQCGFAGETHNSTEFTAAVDRRLRSGAALFLLISGFENANETCRRELAGTLRGLTEQHLGAFRVALFGGQRLLEQKYGNGKLSFLSHAEVEEWPDPDPADVLAWQRQDFQALSLDLAEAHRLLEVSGGHAGQVRGCLERWTAAGGEPAWEEWCYVCPELWETWTRLAADAADDLRENLSRERLGPAIPWPPSALNRRLYWADFLKAHGGQLSWRSDLIKRVGEDVLG